MIYGKIFSSMYDGSMAGAGSDVFAVWGFVISHMRPATVDREEHVRLNVKVLAASIGAPEAHIEKAIEYLCSPDPHTTTKGEDGRRLVRIEPFVYRVVNGRKYREVIDEDDRRAKAAVRQSLLRERRKAAKTPRHSMYHNREKRFVEALERGDEAKADSIAAEGLKDE